MKKVATIGGGGGHSAVVAALKDLPIDLSALVNMVDDGGSSGRLMRERGIHSPGDIRKVLSASGPKAETALEPRNSVGDTAGNLLLAGLEEKFLSFQKAIDAIRQQFNIPYHVFPLTDNCPILYAETISSKTISGQAEIAKYIRANPDDPYTKLWIAPEASSLSIGAREAITTADFVILTMGDLYGSITPAFCIRELTELWPKLKAKIIWMPNFAVAPGHLHYKTTSGALAFLQSLNPAFKPDIVIAHNYSLTQEEQQRLKSRGYATSAFDLSESEFTIIKDDLLDHSYVPKEDPTDVINRSPVAHQLQKLKSIFNEILS